MKLAFTLCAALTTAGCTTHGPSLYLHMFTAEHVVATARVQPGAYFSAGGLSGMIDRRGDAFYANVSGKCEGTGTTLCGEIELESPRLPTAIGGSVLTLGVFVLSTNADGRAFIRQSARASHEPNVKP
ncbi:MAG TPA: hypothetical protein VKY92_22185 [Verrucomicrobiae bacterium]|nr:hypothetical protein [Verrucomicrobiae bacterium]